MRETLAPLDDAGLLRGVEALAAVDPDLGGIVDRHGPPPLWAREPGFETLVQIILEQQVSLASAEAARQRLVRAAGAIEPEAIVRAGERSPARGRTDPPEGALPRRAGGGSHDRAAGPRRRRRRRQTTTHAPPSSPSLGIGRWTADIYLLMGLGRPDVWPDGDLALAGAMRRAKGLAALPTRDEQRRVAAAWQPWRAVAARILWHAYLSGER